MRICRAITPNALKNNRKKDVIMNYKNKVNAIVLLAGLCSGASVFAAEKTMSYKKDWGYKPYYSQFKGIIPNVIEHNSAPLSGFSDPSATSHALLRKMGCFKSTNVAQFGHLKKLGVVGDNSLFSIVSGAEPKIIPNRGAPEAQNLLSRVNGIPVSNLSIKWADTKTTAGRACLLKMLSNPTVDTKKIIKRRTIIDSISKQVFSHCWFDGEATADVCVKKIIDDKNSSSVSLNACAKLIDTLAIDTASLKETFNRHCCASPDSMNTPGALAKLTAMRILRSGRENFSSVASMLTASGIRSVLGGFVTGATVDPSKPLGEEGKKLGTALLGSAWKSMEPATKELLSPLGFDLFPHFYNGRYKEAGLQLLFPAGWWHFPQLIGVETGVLSGLNDIKNFGSIFKEAYKQGSGIFFSDEARKKLPSLLSPMKTAGGYNPQLSLMSHYDAYWLSELGEAEQKILDVFGAITEFKDQWTSIKSILVLEKSKKAKIVDDFYKQLDELEKASVFTKTNKSIQLFWQISSLPEYENPFTILIKYIGKIDALAAVSHYISDLKNKGLSVCNVDFKDQDDLFIDIKGAYHPLVASALDKKNKLKTLVKNDIHFDKDERNILLVAPNTAGKSVLGGTISFELEWWAQTFGKGFGTAFTLTPISYFLVNKNIDQKMQKGTSTGREQVNSIGALTSQLKKLATERDMITHRVPKVLVFGDELLSGLPEKHATEILFEEGGLFPTLNKNPYIASVVISHFDLQSEVQKLNEGKNSFVYKNMEVKEKNNGKFKYTYKIQPGAGFWFNDKEQRERFTTFYRTYLEERKKKDGFDVQSCVYQNKQYISLASLPAAMRGNEEIADFLQGFVSSNVITPEHCKKLGIIKKNDSLWHEISDNGKRFTTESGKPKLAEWLMSPANTDAEIKRRQDLVELVRDKNKRAEVRTVLKEFASVEKDFGNNLVKARQNSVNFCFKNVRDYCNARAAELGLFGEYLKDDKVWSETIWRRMGKFFVKQGIPYAKRILGFVGASNDSVTVTSSVRAGCAALGVGTFVVAPILTKIFTTPIKQALSSGIAFAAGRQSLYESLRAFKSGMINDLLPKSPLGAVSLQRFLGQLTGVNAGMAFYHKDYKNGVVSLAGTVSAYALSYLLYRYAMRQYAESALGRAENGILHQFDNLCKVNTIFGRAQKSCGTTFAFEKSFPVLASFKQSLQDAQKGNVFTRAARKINVFSQYCGAEAQYRVDSCLQENEKVTSPQILPAKPEVEKSAYKDDEQASIVQVYKLFEYFGELDSACVIADWLDALEASGVKVGKAEFIQQGEPHLVNATHPLLLRYQRANKGKVVANSVDFSKKRNYVMAAPNSAGKTVFLGTVGLCTALAHACGWGPWESYKLQRCDAIVFQKKLTDDIAAGESTGSNQAGSILDAAQLVNWAKKEKKHVLFIADEPLSGVPEAVFTDFMFNEKILGLLNLINQYPGINSIIATHFAFDVKNLQNFARADMEVFAEKMEAGPYKYRFDPTFTFKEGSGFWLSSNPEDIDKATDYMRQYSDKCRENKESSL